MKEAFGVGKEWTVPGDPWQEKEKELLEKLEQEEMEELKGKIQLTSNERDALDRFESAVQKKNMEELMNFSELDSVNSAIGKIRPLSDKEE